MAVILVSEVQNRRLVNEITIFICKFSFTCTANLRRYLGPPHE